MTAEHTFLSEYGPIRTGVTIVGGIGGFAIVAVPVGLIPAAALVTVIDGGIPLALPWPTILVVAVGVPVVACLGSVMASRRDPGMLGRAA